LVEHVLGKDGVTGSSPVIGSRRFLDNYGSCLSVRIQSKTEGFREVSSDGEGEI
jgi:hypothetical protein